MLKVLSALLGSPEYRLFDDGTISYAASRAAVGEFPHLAFPYFYAGGWEIVLSQVFRVFGPSLGVAQWTLGVSMALTGSGLTLLLGKMRISTVLAVCLGFAGTLAAYALHFQILPAWPSSAAVLFGMLFLLTGMEKGERKWLIAAGICLGLASSMKQNEGIYAGMAFLLYAVLWYSRSLRHSSARIEGVAVRLTGRVANAALTAVAIVLIPILLMFIMSSHMTIMNVLMFLTLPCAVTFFVVMEFSRTCFAFAAQSAGLVRNVWRTAFALLFGAFLGFLPIVSFYAIQGGLRVFLTESFLKAQDVSTATFVGFTTQKLSGSIESTIVYVGPLLIIAWTFGYALRIRKGATHAEPAEALLLTSFVLTFLYFTLYPNPYWVYVNYLVPLLLMPAALLFDAHVYRKIPNLVARWVSISAIAVLFATCVAIPYVASCGTWRPFSDRIAWLDDRSGQTYVYASWAAYLAPLVGYLRTQPDSTRFIAYDLHNKTVAFLTGHRIEMDFGQRHHHGGLDLNDYKEIARRIDEGDIGVVILSKRSVLPGAELNALLQRLQQHYSLTLENENHYVFQRTVGRLDQEALQAEHP